MKRRIEQRSLTLLAFLFFAGCGGGTKKADTLKPDHWATSDVSRIGDTTHGGTGGDTLIARKDDEVLAGFERFFDGSRNHQHFYRGAMHFDLSSIAAIKSKVIDSATLTYKIRSSTVRGLDGKPAEFPTTISCAAELYLAGDDWAAKTHPGDVIETAFTMGTLFAKLDASPPGGTTFRIDMTKQAREWLVTPADNLGVVLKGRDEEATPARNDACATRYGELALEVNYTVFEP